MVESNGEKDEGLSLSRGIKAAFLDALTDPENHVQVQNLPVISTVRVRPGESEWTPEEADKILLSLPEDRDGQRILRRSSEEVSI